MILIELQNVYPLPKAFHVFLVMTRQSTFEQQKIDYSTENRLEISSLDVLSNVISRTPTQSKVNIGAGEMLESISCMGYEYTMVHSNDVPEKYKYSGVTFSAKVSRPFSHQSFP